MNQVSYKVLWVEDNDIIVESTQLVADKYSLILDRVPNWDDAKEKLETDFEEYSAIILDALCIIGREKLADKDFIPVTLNSLTEIFTNKGTHIPWYIYSAGTGALENFNSVVEIAEKIRSPYKDEWGEMWFLKDAPLGDPKNVEALFLKIQEVAEKQSQNSVLYKHLDVFAYLGKDRLINSGEARRILLEMLQAFYSPEDNPKFRYDGNALRKIFERLFDAAKEKGLLPEECFDKNGAIIAKARDFMVGRNIDCYENGKLVYKLRYGKAGNGKDGEGGDSIFNHFTAQCVENILEYANENSHVYVNENTKELFFGYVMHLCNIIRDFGKFVEKHPDAVSNREMHLNPTVNYNIGDIYNEEFNVLNGYGFYYAGDCKLIPKLMAQVKIGAKIKIIHIERNTDKDKMKYPFIATQIKKL